MDVDDELERAGCTEAFDAVQLCLADNNRDWSKVSERES